MALKAPLWKTLLWVELKPNGYYLRVGQRPLGERLKLATMLFLAQIQLRIYSATKCSPKVP